MLNIFSSLYTLNVIFCNEPRLSTVHRGKTRGQSDFTSPLIVIFR